MKSEFKRIITDKFIVSIPKKYKTRKRNPFLRNKLFFSFYKRKIKKDLPELAVFMKKNHPDLDALKGQNYYEVKMGKHLFIFHTESGERNPEDLAHYIESQTRQKVHLETFEINGLKGTKFGNYSHIISWIDWWIKKENCMIYFNFQGHGMPSQIVKDDVCAILENLKYSQ